MQPMLTNGYTRLSSLMTRMMDAASVGDKQTIYKLSQAYIKDSDDFLDVLFALADISDEDLEKFASEEIPDDNLVKMAEHEPVKIPKTGEKK